MRNERSGHGEARWPLPSPVSRAFVPPCSACASALAIGRTRAGLLSDQTFDEPEP
ncbi:hypothetical protein C7S13_8367 [Burkholderia cepacia]|nr:hypothetical protein [Burkholderia cepacia]MDW9245655.1 hypothetical protein [Burkholderia cepacia]